jgi:integrase
VPRKRYPTISQGSDGLWHAWVTVGTKPNGRPDQRHIKRATEGEVEERVDELLAQKQTGRVQRGGRSPLAETWIETVYFETVAPLSCNDTTIEGARKKLRRYAWPVMGKVPMSRLKAENITAVYVGMIRAGLAEATILQVHHIVMPALKAAFRQGVLSHNVAELIDRPKFKPKPMAAPSLDAAERILAVTDRRRSSARWRCGLGLGLRQGEALGLRWSMLDIDSDDPTATIHWQLHRRPFQHGCGAAPCGRRRAGNCPQRVLPLRKGEIQVEGGLILKKPKGSSYGVIPLPAEIVEELRRHREIQELEKVMAGPAYARHDFVFARLDGGPISPEADWKEWQEIEQEAGVQGITVHDGRHFTASFLLALGVDSRVVQTILRHSSIKVTEAYMDVASELKREATSRIGKALPAPKRDRA